ncbi:deoxyribodipyrimidine photo-lyase [Ophiostoma piceae UAMH 11346]|uniref:Deoxyribodipyrimidine photo-lyase n=1 Tax=Ophiostoma piceae (strain UAMH 11346) TaxID=1262450 RepID=S3BU56_OPHP1|nr:deoxyribodipyrimidine photo-lyase [Ophiostoma piceae UAMH 11346]
MGPKSAAPASTAAKRKASVSSSSAAGGDAKKSKVTTADKLHAPHSLHKIAEEHGVVLRKYYPHEMSNARAEAYIDDEIPKPFDEMVAALEETAKDMRGVKPGGAVVHWFKTDLRTNDNRALAMAADKAANAGVPLICLYIISPEDWEAHLRAPVRVDLILRTLKVLQDDLAKLNIPLWIETVDKRKNVRSTVHTFMESWNANHLFANMEYEVDELRRETALVRECASKGKSMTVIHDTCVVPPGRLTSSSSGRPYAVYTPWFKTWKQHIHDNEDLVDLVDTPAKQADDLKAKVSKLFGCAIPESPKNKQLTKDEKTRFAKLWPAGEHEAVRRLQQFCDDRINGYSRNRDFPAQDATSSLSPYLACGAISARTMIQTAFDRTGAKALDRGTDGFKVWVSEVAWRDFYRHVLAGWPYVCMNKPFKAVYSNIEWSYNKEHFTAWCEGRTGYPIVDAAMRQLREQGWMHNRCRMIVASFLAKDLLIDWRMGEKFFMENLVDGDFSSNNGGWGFSASVGVDPQPYFRIFNPTRQSERFDPDGVYIRHYVPELAKVFEEGASAIHEPYAKEAAKARKAGYPEPLVPHKDAREKALAAYKKGLGK